MGAFRHSLAELYWESPLLQNLYSGIASRAARSASKTMYDSLELYCAAARRVESPELKSARMQELSEFLQRAFSQHPPSSWSENVFVRSFLESERARVVRSGLRKLDPARRADLAGNLLIVKAPQAREKGAVVLHYTGAFDQFLVNFDLDAIEGRYAIVVEPSWATFPEPFWVLLATNSSPVVCEVITDDLGDVIRRLGLPIVPIAIGAQDWVDPNLFRPIGGIEKEFDAVMVGNFGRFKRHSVLFTAMQKRPLRGIRVAVVGQTLDRTRAEFDAEIRRYGVADRCTVFQAIPPKQVNEVLNRSKVNVLLSKREGGNRALMEAFSANVPAVVYKHIVGPRHTDINAMTGVMSEDDELADVLADVIGRYRQFEAREWLMHNTGYAITTAKLNSVLKEEALRRGENWTTDIVPKANGQASLYVSQKDCESMVPAYEELKRFLRPLE